VCELLLGLSGDMEDQGALGDLDIGHGDVRGRTHVYSHGDVIAKILEDWETMRVVDLRKFH
jgi:hypothetical protein